MINFRYHLVSLIAVFLALAVGIVLGIGPLKGPVSDELGSQVSQLRERNDQLRDEASKATQSVKERDEYLAQGSAQLVGGLLQGQSVAIVSMGGVNGPERDSVKAKIEQAGASPAADVRLSDTWWKADGGTDLTAALTEIRALDPPPALDESLTDAQQLAQALAIALAGTAAERAGMSGTEPPAQSGRILDALRGHKLVTGTQDRLATAVVVLTEKLDSAQPGATADPADTAEGQAGFLVATQMVGTGAPTVVAGPATWSGDAVSLVRSADDMKERASTVDNAGEMTGQISVPRAIAAGFHGVIGHYGTQQGATGPVTGETTSTSSVAPPYLPVSPPVPNAQGRANGATL